MLSVSGIPGEAAEGGSETDSTMLKKVRERWGRKREVQNVHVNSVHLHVYEIMLTQATTHTHTHSSYMTLIGVHEISGRVAPFCQQYLFSQPFS